jgi:hypothetical protein
MRWGAGKSGFLLFVTTLFHVPLHVFVLANLGFALGHLPSGTARSLRSPFSRFKDGLFLMGWGFAFQEFLEVRKKG